MRLLVSFAGGLLVALALFALMIALVMPPEETQEQGNELARISFVRSVADTSSEAGARQTRTAPERPQTPPVPTQTTPMSAQVPQVSASTQLNISVPSLPTSGVSIAFTPSMDGLSAAEMPGVTAGDVSEGASGTPGLAEEVSPLVDIPPNYPQRALAANIEGEVTLAFTITAEGTVDNLRVVSAKPRGVFDREARRAASRWRFAPRRENGQPVAREATKTLYFRLEGR